MSKILITSLLILTFFPAAGLAQEAVAPMLSVDQVVEKALAANPRIGVARQRAEALSQRVPQAGALDDPMLGFSVVNVPSDLDFGAEPMTMKEIMISQKFPFFGKRALRRAAAADQAAAGNAETEEIANQIVRDAKQAFYDLSHVHRAMDITLRNKTILEDFSRLAQTRYAVGEGIQEDVVRVQVEISRMLDELLMLEQKKQALEARLNYLMNRPSNTPVGTPAELLFRPFALDTESLQQSALDHNPVLRSMRHMIDVREKNADLARKEIYPDFNLRFSYGQRDDMEDLYTAGIEINLPVFAGSKQNRKVDESLAELRSDQENFEAMKNEIFFMIADMRAMARRLEKQVDLYKTGILPQANLQIQSALSAYTVNKADFMTLLDSRMQLYRYELDYHQALTEHEKNIASLEAAVGKRLAQFKEEK